MHPQRIEIFDRADDDDVVVGVAHHLQLVFLPTKDRFLDQHFRNGRQLQAAANHVVEFAPIVRHRRAAPSHGETRSQHAGQANHLEHFVGFGQIVHRPPAANLQPDLHHRLFEFFAILGLANDVGPGTDHLYPVFGQHAVLVQFHRQVQRRLAPQRRQQRVGPLGFDHPGNDFPGQRLDVGAIGHARIGHDRRRIRIDQHHLIAFFAQGFAGLGSRIIELAGLTDHDRARANQQNSVNIVPTRHGNNPSTAQANLIVSGRRPAPPQVANRPPPRCFSLINAQPAY